MGRKKVVTTREEVDGGDAEVKITTIPDDDEEDTLSSFDGLLDGGIRFRVHKFPTKPGEGNSYCQDYSAEELSLDAIRASWGGGRFRITAFDDKNKIKGSKQVTIADLPKSSSSTNGAAAPAAPAAADGTHAMLLAFIKSQGDMVAALLSRETAPPPSGPTAMELVALIKALQPEKVEDPTALLLKGLDLGRSLGGDGGTDMLSVAKSGLEALAPLIAKQNQAPPAPPRPAIQRNPAPNPPLTPPQAAAPAQPEDPQKMDMLKKLEWLRQVTVWLLSRASKDKDPAIAADFFMEDLPPFVTHEEIFERFSDPGAVAMLAQLDPRVPAYSPWFEKFRLAVLDTFETDEEPPSPPNGADLGEGADPEGMA